MPDSLSQYLPVFTLIIGALSAYFGAQMALKVELARIQERLNALEKRQDSDHAQLDELRDKVRV